ncbi:MAG: hypothetical protein GXO23_07265 [Crenarchaeota archaeon]|nr:hypothetical protein [Thermoproteota archaeon]
MLATSIGLRRVLRENPRAVSAIVAWLVGYTRYDVVKMFNVDIDSLRSYGIVLDEFGEYMLVSGGKYRRYSKESIEKLISDLRLDPVEVFIALCRALDREDAKILAYTADFVRRYGRFSLYGISDYIRCIERPENVNVEFRVLLTLQKYLVYMCDRSHKCVEYSWTMNVIDNISRMLRYLVYLPSDDDILRELKTFLSKDMNNNIEILAALYSMCTGTIDQFQIFHKCRIQDVLRDVSEIRYVYYNGFVNPLALDLIVKIVREEIIDKIVSNLGRALGEPRELKDEDMCYLTYVFDNALVRVPKMYYLSPIFWARPGAINVVYRVPKNVNAYLATYRPYFEGGFLVICQGSEILKIFAFPEHDPTVKERLKEICDIVDL